MDNVFTGRLNQVLLEQNITQRQLSEMSHITEASVSRYVNGSRIPKTHELIKIADALNVSIDYLLGRDGFDFEFMIKQLEILSNDPSWGGLDVCSQLHTAKLVLKQAYEDVKEIRRENK